MDDTDRKLWDLLGRSPQPVAPPFFAARVMRAVEEAGRPKPRWFDALLRLLAPTTVAALFVLAVLPRPGATGNALSSNGEITTLDLVEMLTPDDYATLTAAGWPYDNGFLSAGL